MDTKTVWMLDYGAGNVRSVVNAVKYLGYEIKFVETVDDIRNAPRLLFPGVGAFGRYVQALAAHSFSSVLKLLGLIRDLLNG